MVMPSPGAAACGPGRRECCLLLAGCLLAACAAGAGPDAQNQGRRALEAADEPVRMILVGNPFDMDQARLSALVGNELAAGVTGMSTAFTTSPGRAAAPEPHLVVVLNPVDEPSPDALCVAPETIATATADEQLRVLGAFCRGDAVLNVARTEAAVSGPTDHRFRRLLWRTSSALFPDDYAETYGFGILPRWIDLGVGGSMGR